MDAFVWSYEKNEKLKKEREISFEEAILNIQGEGLLDTIEHPNTDKYGHQRIFIVLIRQYVYMVPFVESKQGIFLKTIIPSRKLTKKYLN